MEVILKVMALLLRIMDLPKVIMVAHLKVTVYLLRDTHLKDMVLNKVIGLLNQVTVLLPEVMVVILDMDHNNNTVGMDMVNLRRRREEEG